MKNRIVFALAETASSIIQTLKLGAGSTWPGHIALSINPHIVRELVQKYPHVHILLVAGTNGKTTTATMMRFLLEHEGYTVFQNEEGANLLNGIATSLIRNQRALADKKVVAIFEVDENTVPAILKEITPSALVLLNLFRDQLDRYGEVNAIAGKWKEALCHMKGRTMHLVVNADDPQIAFIGETAPAHMKLVRFGLDPHVMHAHTIAHDVDSVYCPRCGTKLHYNAVSYSHVGDYACPSCGFKKEYAHTFIHEHLHYPLRGIYNHYNTHAALATIHTLFNISIARMVEVLPSFRPAFGRQEEIRYKNRRMFIQLAKNPASFNQSLQVTKELVREGGSILIVLNDRIPDGRDVSWIWDVEFEELAALKIPVTVSGDRVYDMVLRLKYAEVPASAFESLEQAIDHVVHTTAETGTVVILPTYCAMLEVRKIIKGRALL